MNVDFLLNNRGNFYFFLKFLLFFCLFSIELRAMDADVTDHQKSCYSKRRHWKIKDEEENLRKRWKSVETEIGYRCLPSLPDLSCDMKKLLSMDISILEKSLEYQKILEEQHFSYLQIKYDWLDAQEKENELYLQSRKNKIELDNQKFLQNLEKQYLCKKRKLKLIKKTADQACQIEIQNAMTKKEQLKNDKKILKLKNNNSSNTGCIIL